MFQIHKRHEVCKMVEINTFALMFVFSCLKLIVSSSNIESNFRLVDEQSSLSEFTSFLFTHYTISKYS